ncbi:MAG: hypothetical protein ABL958_02845 [Bdellovibrionia bacterium]
MKRTTLSLVLCSFLIYGCIGSGGGGETEAGPSLPGADDPKTAPVPETPVNTEKPKPSGPQSRYWFAPGPARSDILDLFTQESRWPKARALVKVLQLYGSAVLFDNNCKFCGSVDLDNLRARNAFGKMKEWGMSFSLEVGAIKWGTPEGCDASALVTEATTILRKLHAIGATLQYFALDNPSVAGVDDCHMSEEDIARVMADYTTKVRAVDRELFPNEPPVKFILLDNYIKFRADGMIRLMEKMLAAGSKIDGFHPDLDYNHARQLVKDEPFKNDLKKLQDYAKAKGMEYGILFFGVNGDSDKAFVGDVLSWARKYKRLMGGAPPNSIVQSWAWWFDSDGNAQSRPAVLSESDNYTHAKLTVDLNQTFIDPVPWLSFLTDLPYKP